jgi:deoxyribose-phosphate aldolase
VEERDLARRIDHTLLKPEATRANISALCSEATEYGFHAVCVNPCYVELAADLLTGQASHHVRICTVVGFPLGATTTKVKLEETRGAVEDGAHEIDMVINLGALVEGRFDYVQQEISALAQLLKTKAHLTLKVIIEAPMLTNDQKLRACQIARDAGAHFVKTSTGFHPNGGATAEDVALLHRAVGTQMGIKAAGGIHNLESALKMIHNGASRLGTSSGVRIIEELRAARHAVR